MSLIPQAFHLTFRNAWVSIGKLSYIICQNTYFFTFVKTNHYVRRPDKKVPIITQAHKKDIMKSQRAKNAVRKLLMSIFFLECIGMTSVYSQVHEAIKPHVDCKHSIFRHDNFIGCFSADKIKMSVRK